MCFRTKLIIITPLDLRTSLITNLIFSLNRSKVIWSKNLNYVVNCSFSIQTCQRYDLRKRKNKMICFMLPYFIDISARNFFLLTKRPNQSLYSEVLFLQPFLRSRNRYITLSLLIYRCAKRCIRGGETARLLGFFSFFFPFFASSGNKGNFTFFFYYRDDR